MVLCPVVAGSCADEGMSQLENTSPIPAWRAVEQRQKQSARGWLLIAQTDHAQLAGDLAARLQSPFIPELAPDVIQAIAVHDAGWASFDTSTPESGSGFNPKLDDRGKPLSFLEASPAEFVVAWTGSITKAEMTGPAGGIMVSQHFCTLAESRLDSRIDDEEDTSRLRHFLHHEVERQNSLLSATQYSNSELKQLTEVLQFCDLLSLYLCCGATEAVEFAEIFQSSAITVRRSGNVFRFDPAVFGRGASLGVCGRVYPASTVSSQSLAFLLR